MNAILPRKWPSPDGKPLPPAETTEAVRAFARDLAAGRRPWDTTRATGRDDPLRDALDRGGSFPQGPCLEVGSGTGLFTPLLASLFSQVISVDLSEQMLRQAAGRSPLRVRADVGALPVADARIAVVAAIDMLLFPAEIARVLAPDGVLLWINQLGEDGPLYLPAADVAAALPGRWRAVEAHAGWGSWAALRRAH